jgi:hypothetical protein
MLLLRGASSSPDREPSRLAAGGNGLGCWTFWRLLALVAAASRDGSRSDSELDAALGDQGVSPGARGPNSISQAGGKQEEAGGGED